MYFSTIVSIALTSLASLTVAADPSPTLGSAIVVNNCTDSIYVWSVGSSAGPEITVPAGMNFSEVFFRDLSVGGVAIKVTTVKDGLYSSAPQTIFAYNLVNDTVWYDLSDVFGDPFSGENVKVEPSDPPIDWHDGIPPAGSQVRLQDATVDLVVTFC